MDATQGDRQHCLSGTPTYGGFVISPPVPGHTDALIALRVTIQNPDHSSWRLTGDTDSYRTINGSLHASIAHGPPKAMEALVVELDGELFDVLVRRFPLHGLISAWRGPADRRGRSRSLFFSSPAL